MQTLASTENLFLFVFVYVLMFPNWLIESYKWKLITASIETISFSNAIKGVCAGICIGNLTPGRVGEFAGRLIYFLPENRSKITITHFVCGSTQLFVTVATGVLATISWFTKNTTDTDLFALVLAIALALLAALLFLFIKIDTVYKKIASLKMLSKFNFGEVHYPKTILIQLLSWSTLRYFVFSSQYVLLLKICGAKGNYFDLLIPVAISFMLMSSIPMISFIEVAIRAGIAIILFSQYISNDLLIVTASTALWFINIITPSIIGYFIILGTKINLKKQSST